MNQTRRAARGLPDSCGLHRVTADEDATTASGAMIRSLHRAIGSAAHPDCPACRALLPVLAAYLVADVISPPA